MSLRTSAHFLFSYRIFLAVCLLCGAVALLVGWYATIPLALVFGVGLAAGGLVSYLALCPTNNFRLGKAVLSERVLAIVYLILLAVLAVAFYISGYRSLSVLALTSTLYIISLITIFYSHSSFGLILFLSSSIIHRGTMFFSSQVVFGNDPLFHARIAAKTAELGGIVSEAGKYVTTPLYHIWIALNDTLLGVSTHHASFVVTVSYVLIPSIFIFVLCSRLLDDDAAVIAVVLFVASEHAIRWSIEPSTTTYGVLLFVTGLFTAFRWLDDTDHYFLAMLILISTVMALAHQVSAFILVLVVSAMVGFSLLASHREPSFVLVQPLLSIYLVVGAVWTIGEYQRLGNQYSFIQVLTLNIARRIQFGNPDRVIIVPPETMDVVIMGPTYLPLLHVAGFGTLLFLGITGALCYQRWEIGVQSAELLLPVVGIMFFVSFGTGSIITLLQPTRWFQFIYVFLAILGGFGLLSIVASLPNGYRIIVAIFVISSYLVLMGGAVPAGLDGVVHDDTQHRSDERVTASEYQLLQFASGQDDTATVIGDFHASTVIVRHHGGTATTYKWNLDGVQTSGGPQLLIERPLLYSGYAKFLYTSDQGTRRVSGLPPTSLDQCADQTVYSVGGEASDISRIRYTEERCGSS